MDILIQLILSSGPLHITLDTDNFDPYANIDPTCYSGSGNGSSHGHYETEPGTGHQRAGYGRSHGSYHGMPCFIPLEGPRFLFTTVCDVV